MRTLTIMAVALAWGSVAQAKVPFLNATCGNGIEVHADQGGPVYINGNQAKLKKTNDSYYEASHGHVTVSLSIDPDGSPMVSYTGSHGANGICRVSQTDGSGARGESAGKACPPDVSQADRYKYPACD